MSAEADARELADAVRGALVALPPPERAALLRALAASCAEVADTEQRPTVRRALLRVVRAVARPA